MVVIDSSGNVGIGDRNPVEAKLVVSGTAVNSTGVWSILSDQRAKQNILPLENSLDKISQLEGVSFFWKDPERGAGLQRGFIAQEVGSIFPEWVREDGNGYLMLEKTGIEAVLVEAIKELEKENQELEQRIEQLEEDKEWYQKKLEELDLMINLIVQ